MSRWINSSMWAIVRKDFYGITQNKRLCVTLWLVPLILTTVMPTIFILAITFAPEEINDLEQLLSLLPATLREAEPVRMVAGLLINYIMPVFFLMIPIMASSVMAAGSFVGEKEKRTLETLLYCPLSLKQIFRAKVLADFLLSMLVSMVSFVVMVLVLETEMFLAAGSVLWPDVKWLLVLFLVSPAVSLIAITLIVRVSAKAQSMEDAQQGAVFLILPVIMLVAGQFTGMLLVNGWVLLGIGGVCALLAFLLLKAAVGKQNYERLLQ